MKNEKEYKIDPLTGEKFIPKRSNQIYANTKNREKYNNKLAKELKENREIIDKPYKKSHLLIKSLYEADPKKVYHIHFLLGRGVDFDSARNKTRKNQFLLVHYNYGRSNLPNSPYYRYL